MATVSLCLLAACGGSTPPSTPTMGNLAPQAVRPDALKTPALIAVDTTTGGLVYWPTNKGPNDHPITLTGSLGLYEGYAMAADGDTVIVANYSPAEIVTYNVKTKATTTLPDSYGGPLDVAVDKQGTIYAMNFSNVKVFPSGSSSGAYEVSCAYMQTPEAIAVDNEGDIYINGYELGNSMGVVEIPAGSSGSKCVKLRLRPEHGYVAGVGIDPKTDDLTVVDNPDLCAGGLEGRMVVYPKPYSGRTARRHDLGASYCAGTFRLDATSKHIYVSDATVSAGYLLIDVHSYPRGRGAGVYGTGYGDTTGGFTTIPNTLPN
jgi:hypothetical protein